MTKPGNTESGAKRMSEKRLLPRRQIETAFNRYVADYNPEDPKIRLKIGHSYRVAALCETIARSAGADDTELAWLVGMLHDIGRFEQVRRYNTFSDAQSVDHAAFGADLLFGEGLLEQVAPELEPERRRILELAIRNHSAYRIQDGLSETERLYCHILRDADKIDIFRVNCETPLEDIYNVATRELKTAPVSEKVKQCFLNRTAVPRKDKKTAIDYVVGHLCLVFELVYPVSREIAKEQGYVARLLSYQSENPETKTWFDYMQSHIWDE